MWLMIIIMLLMKVPCSVLVDCDGDERHDVSDENDLNDENEKKKEEDEDKVHC